MAKGFGGEVFLTQAELDTYKKRMPVRYIKFKLSDTCYICGLTATPDNPLQRAHRVPFNSGILRFSLTPDWLDGPHNIVSAHRKSCNKAAELSVQEITAIVNSLKAV